MRLSESLGVAGDKAEERAEIARASPASCVERRRGLADRAADRSEERKRSDRLG